MATTGRGWHLLDGHLLTNIVKVGVKEVVIEKKALSGIHRKRGNMKFYSISFLAGLVLVAFATGCHETKTVKGISYDQNSQDFYSGCPQYPASTPLNLKSSLVENPEEASNSLKAPPCLMTMRVHPDFLEGYTDNLNGRRPRIRNRTQEYADGYNLYADDFQKRISRRLEAIIK